MKFKTLAPESLTNILGQTIKGDLENKLVTFLCMLSAYTEDSQFNLSFSGPSSSGKSFIASEVKEYFPKEDIWPLGNCSPSSFFHQKGIPNKEKNEIVVDLSRKIIIFLDQPSNELLVRLRPLLSHDAKEIKNMITDKNPGGGNRTKTVILKGFPSVIFCSAYLKMDEQESTRFLLLSPETNQDKIRNSILEKITKESDKSAYEKTVNSNLERIELMKRIVAIKNEGISEIKISNLKLIEEGFLKDKNSLRARDQRDIAKLISLIKMFALLNLWDRKREGNCIFANDEDINDGFVLWEGISVGQQFGISPHLFNVYKEVIVPAFLKKNELKELTVEVLKKDYEGLSKSEIITFYHKIYSTNLHEWQLREQILPMLESAGLIMQERDVRDKRFTSVFPKKLLN